MFCPNCGAEYRPGFQRCTDCDVDLVDQLPERRKAKPESAGPVVVFVTTSVWEADLVKSLLRANGIKVYAFNENFTRIDPPIATMSGSGIQLVVAPKQEEPARAVLEEYRGAAGQNPTHGRSLPFAMESDDVKHRCPKCNARVEAETTVCPHCGHRL